MSETDGLLQTESESYIWESPEDGDGENWTLFWPGQGDFDYATVYHNVEDGQFEAEIGQGGRWGGSPFWEEQFPTLEEAKSVLVEQISNFMNQGNTTARVFQPEYPSQYT